VPLPVLFYLACCSRLYLDLKPLSIEANLTNALSRQNIRVDVPCRFTIAISTESV
jgi:flotillin